MDFRTFAFNPKNNNQMTNDQKSTLDRISKEHTGLSFSEMVLKNTNPTMVEKVVEKFLDGIVGGDANHENVLNKISIDHSGHRFSDMVSQSPNPAMVERIMDGVTDSIIATMTPAEEDKSPKKAIVADVVSEHEIIDEPKMEVPVDEKKHGQHKTHAPVIHEKIHEPEAKKKIGKPKSADGGKPDHKIHKAGKKK